MKTYEERTNDIAEKVCQRKRRRAILRSVTATTCCLILVAGLLLVPGLYRNEGNDEAPGYSRLITELKALEQNSDLYKGDPSDMIIAGPEAVPDNGSSVVHQGTYAEVTDIQVQGVTEADLIKRSDRHIYYLREDTLVIYSIEGENSKELGSYRIEAATGCRIYPRSSEMYLSQDCTTITILTECYDDIRSQKYLYVLDLDVTDPEDIKKTCSIYLSGNYHTSRMVGDALYLITTLYVGFQPDYTDPSTFLPGHGTPEDMDYLPMKDILIPDAPTESMFTVVSKLDRTSLELLDSMALLSYAGPVYVSRQNIFLTRTYQEQDKSGNRVTGRTMTEITQLRYDRVAIENEGSFCVAGTVKDQYSMDEHEGILRIFTTTEGYTATEQTSGDHSYLKDYRSVTNASLYCIDLSDHRICATVESFAPKDESVRSVRFDGDQAYVCTSIVLSDPVFFFDLSDLEDIRYKDTGTITGYSMSLVELKDGFLMGIGYGDSFDTLKIEIYRESETAVEPYCAYEVPNCWFSTDHKSYYIDRERQLIGLGLIGYTSGERYLLLHFDGHELVELADTPMEGDPQTVRGVCIGDDLYICANELLVETIR